MYLDRMGYQEGSSDYGVNYNFPSEENQEGNDQTEKYTEEFSKKFSGLDIQDREQMLNAQQFIMKTFGKDQEAGKAVLSLLNEKVSAQLHDVDSEDEKFVNTIMETLGNLTDEDIETIMGER